MSNSPTCNWPGKSGAHYTYHIFPLGTVFKAEAGNYIFCKKNAAGKWTPQYIGQTDNLGERLGRHNKRDCAVRNGATHVHAHLSGPEANRLAEERDLIQNFNPTCNVQLVA